MSGQPRAFGPDLILFGLTVWWGITFVVVKDALDDADPFTFLALRFFVGGLAATLLAGREVFERQSVVRGLKLSVFLFAGYALQTVGLGSTTPARSAFITGLAVVLVPAVSMLLFRRVPRWPSWAGVGLAVAGLFLLTGIDAGELGQTRFGDWLTMGCAAAFAFHIVLTERYAREVPVRPMVAVQLWVVAVGSALFIPFGTPRLEMTVPFIGAVLLTGALGSAVAINLQSYAQARTSAVRAALIYSLEPVFAAAYSSVLGRDALGRREWLGGALLMVAVVVAETGNWFLERKAAGATAA